MTSERPKTDVVLDYFRSHLEDCRLCPRECGVNRLAGDTGFCRAGTDIKVSSWGLHRGEEPPISGDTGSGTIFFSHCSMACLYCQNYPISQLGHGNHVTPEDLASAMLALEMRGAHNINLVTPTHFLPGIVDALIDARKRGLKIPIVYNTSGYERARVVQMLAGLVQIYLADMRYADPAFSASYSDAPDYPRFNRESIRQMFDQTGVLRCSSGVGVEGLIIRHLVLPAGIAGTESTMKFISEEISSRVHVSLMSQYFPANKAHSHHDLSRRITAVEYEAAVATLHKYGLENGWVQQMPPGPLPTI